MAPSGDVPLESGSAKHELLSLDEETVLLQGEATLLAGEPALGRDPFAETTPIDPFLERLDQLGAVRRSPEPARSRSKPRPRLSRPAAVRPRRAATPPLAEVEAPPATGFADRLLGEELRRRLAAVAHLA